MLFKEKAQATVVEELPVSQKDSDALTLKIHREIDEAEDKMLNDMRDFLSSINVTTEKKLKNKAELAKSLGFTSCEPVKQIEKLEKDNQSILVKKEEKENVINNIKTLKHYYPLEKFITIEVFESILKKYNLVYAPSSFYIKDIPEKNLLEIQKCKMLNFSHQLEPSYTYQFEYMTYVPKKVREWLDNLITKREISGDNAFRELCPFKYKGDHLYTSYGFKITKISKSGYFIAAPPSHFNLEDLKNEKNNKFGYFEVEEKIVSRDPIVFQFVKGDLVRIITKWGTSDDQSYLDPAIQDEKLN